MHNLVGQPAFSYTKVLNQAVANDDQRGGGISSVAKHGWN